MQRVLFEIRKTTITVVLAFATIFLFTKSYGQRNPIVLSGMYHTQLFAGENRFETGYGINCQIFASDRIALEYNFSYVAVPNQINYFKIHGGGLLSGHLAALDNNSITYDDGFFILALFTLLIPEGISYHIPVGKNVTISPYANLLSFDYTEEYLNYSNSLGVRMNMKVFNRINIAPFMFTQVQYRSRARGSTRTGFGMGAMLGWRF